MTEEYSKLLEGLKAVNAAILKNEHQNPYELQKEISFLLRKLNQDLDFEIARSEVTHNLLKQLLIEKLKTSIYPIIQFSQVISGQPSISDFHESDELCNNFLGIGQTFGVDVLRKIASGVIVCYLYPRV